MTATDQASRPYGTCPTCSRPFALTTDRTIRRHRAPDKTGNYCPGSRRLPIETTATVDDLRQRIETAAEKAISAWDADVPGTEDQSLHQAIAAALLPLFADVLRSAADEGKRLCRFEHVSGPRWAAQVSENIGVLRVVDALGAQAGAILATRAAGGAS